MCKLFIVTGINDSNREKTLELLDAMAPKLSQGNNDGLGYAAISKDGKLFGERWFNNSDATFLTPELLAKRNIKNIESYDGSISKSASGYSYGTSSYKAETPHVHNSFGSVDLNTIASITVHTRAATSAKEFKNTHPFVRDQISLIHNGVIHNVHELEQRTSTCDSECILNEYVRRKVIDDPKAIQAVANSLSGYFACGVLAERDVPTLDVFKDNRASLSAIYIPELDITTFCTSEMNIKDACKELGLREPTIYTFKAGHLLRFNALTGAVISTTKFDPTGKAYSYQSQKSTTCGYSHMVTHNKNKSYTQFNKKDGNVCKATIESDANDEGSWAEDAYGHFHKVK